MTNRVSFAPPTDVQVEKAARGGAADWAGWAEPQPPGGRSQVGGPSAYSGPQAHGFGLKNV